MQLLLGNGDGLFKMRSKYSHSELRSSVLYSSHVGFKHDTPLAFCFKNLLHKIVTFSRGEIGHGSVVGDESTDVESEPFSLDVYLVLGGSVLISLPSPSISLPPSSFSTSDSVELSSLKLSLSRFVFCLILFYFISNSATIWKSRINTLITVGRTSWSFPKFDKSFPSREIDWSTLCLVASMLSGHLFFGIFSKNRFFLLR